MSYASSFANCVCKKVAAAPVVLLCMLAQPDNAEKLLTSKLSMRLFSFFSERCQMQKKRDVSTYALCSIKWDTEKLHFLQTLFALFRRKTTHNHNHHRRVV